MSHFEALCLACGTRQPDPAASACAACGGALGFRYDYGGVRWDDRFSGMWRYWRLLPIDAGAEWVTLGEGGTPLLRSRRRAAAEVYLKDETRNPTGSHKDRPLALAVNHARRLGATTSFVVSAGSTGISNAAFAARAGLRGVAIVGKGAPAARVYPLFALGSEILELEEDLDSLIDEVIEICRRRRLYLSSTSRRSNPYQSEGAKTIAYEIHDELGRVPDWIVVPVGGGGTLAAIWRGYLDLRALGRIERLPRMVGVQPRDYNALEVAMERGLEAWSQVQALDYSEAPPSIQAKLAHGHPPDGMEALEAVRASGGLFLSVTDDEALDAQLAFGRREGLYIEPSTGGVPVAVDRLIAAGRIGQGDTVVALICGSGFRETFATLERRPAHRRTIPLDALAETMTRLAG